MDNPPPKKMYINKHGTWYIIQINMVILVQKKEVLTNIQCLNKYSINFMRLFLKK